MSETKIRFQNRQLNFVHSKSESMRIARRENVIGLTLFCQLNKPNRNNSNSSSHYGIEQNGIYVAIVKLKSVLNIDSVHYITLCHVYCILLSPQCVQ